MLIIVLAASLTAGAGTYLTTRNPRLVVLATVLAAILALVVFFLLEGVIGGQLRASETIIQ